MLAVIHYLKIAGSNLSHDKQYLLLLNSTESSNALYLVLAHNKNIKTFNDISHHIKHNKTLVANALKLREKKPERREINLAKK